MKKNNYKIDFEIYFVFILVISVSVFNAIYSTIKIYSSQQNADRILSVEIPSLQMVEEMNLLITQSVMHTTNWVYLPSNPEENKDKLRTLLNVQYPALKGTMIGLLKDDAGERETGSLMNAFDEFDQLIVEQKKIMLLLSDFEDYQNPEKQFTAEEIMSTRITPISTSLISRFNGIIDKKKVHIDVLHAEMADASRDLLLNIQLISLLIVFVILFAVFYMSRKLIVPIMRLKNYILQMGKGELPEIDIRHGSNAVGQMIDAVQTLNASLRETTYFANKIGYGNLSAEFEPLSDKDELRNALLQMRDSLRIADEENKKRSWALYCKEKLNEALRENTDDLSALSDAVISVVVKILSGYQGGIYFIDTDKNGKAGGPIKLLGSYAMDGSSKGRVLLKNEEGLIGQVIRDGEPIYLRNVSNHKKLIYSGFSSFSPSHVLIVPLKYQGEIFGAIELSGFSEFRDFEIEYIKTIGETIGSTIVNVKANMLTKTLLKESRELAVRLAAQEEETRRTNEELSHQSKLLLISEEELKQSNQELQQKAWELQQKNEINEQAKQALSEKAKELEESNKYKSEFLANMSHELRTPLNSVLILAKLLEENKEQNLTEKQIEYASVIQKSGRDLLILINDILDLSKIEAGKIQIVPEETDLSWICKDTRLLFEELAKGKKIDFKIEVQKGLPESLVTDKVRLEQIIKNLLSNAFKFTPSGGKIVLNIKRPENDVVFSNKHLKNCQSVIEFSVTDNGIGIPRDKQEIIFEAFQQADGSINKSFGGTGLGLSISKMLVSLLGGEMQLKSMVGKGSTFYFFIPEKLTNEFETDRSNNVSGKPALVSIRDNDSDQHSNQRIKDDRNDIQQGDKTILIVESDTGFAQILLNMAHERKLKGIVACDGKEGLQYAQEFRPSAIIMEMQLPEMNGWSVLNAIKSNKDLCHIPVHVMSAIDRTNVGMQMGATAYLKKPLDRKDLDVAFTTIDESIQQEFRHVLLVEDVSIHQEIVRNLLLAQYRNVEVHPAKDITTAVDIMHNHAIDFIVLDLDLGKGPEEGVKFLEKIKHDIQYQSIPVVVFTGHDLNENLIERINKLSTKIVNKDGISFENLIVESEQFLQSIIQENETSVKMPLYMSDILYGKSAWLIDDDMRNIYSLSSSFASENMQMITGSSVDEFNRQMENPPDADVIILNIDFRGLESFDVLRRIRSMEKFMHIPIIVLTERTSIGDREKSLQYGASDYISKPFNPGQLLSLLRVWLYQE